MPPHVLATGGGAFIDDEIRARRSRGPAPCRSGSRRRSSCWSSASAAQHPAAAARRRSGRDHCPAAEAIASRSTPRPTSMWRARTARTAHRSTVFWRRWRSEAWWRRRERTDRRRAGRAQLHHSRRVRACWTHAGALAGAAGAGIVPVVTDSNVAARHLQPLLASLSAAGIDSARDRAGTRRGHKELRRARDN